MLTCGSAASGLSRMVSENSDERFVQPSRRDEHRTEVVVRLGKTRLQPGGFLGHSLDRLVNPTQFPQRAPEAVDATSPGCLRAVEDEARV